VILISTNKWDLFILDKELNNSPQYHSSPDGRYLFGKILHDVLECLNSYTAVLYLIKQPGVDIPVETRNWLAAKSSSVEATIADVCGPPRNMRCYESNFS
jgi:hypothetical protein